jgi:hypothetical protein
LYFFGSKEMALADLDSTYDVGATKFRKEGVDDVSPAMVAFAAFNASLHDHHDHFDADTL